MTLQQATELAKSYTHLVGSTVVYFFTCCTVLSLGITLAQHDGYEVSVFLLQPEGFRIAMDLESFMQLCYRRC